MSLSRDIVYVVYCDHVWTDGYKDIPGTHVVSIFKDQKDAAKCMVESQTEADANTSGHKVMTTYGIAKFEVQ